ncbi:hypothetical protein KFE25_000889 [Diacronema lutheri]|uniref:Leucine-rich repeat-containing protein 51 n=1 Tax=Diacronema lutheri TaxID=2081491 RepID=A0A8J5X7C0_DIALT|nr:hypothetical protein KFE25_000889 [Diacronema lutheri]
MNSTVPRFPRDPVIVGRVIGPETYDPRAKPGIEIREPEKKSTPFASLVRRFDDPASSFERSLGPGAYEPNFNAAMGRSGLVDTHEPHHRSPPFASKLARFNTIGMGRGPEPTPPPYFDPQREAIKWQTQSSVAAAWARASRWRAAEAEACPYPLRPDYYNVDASTAVPRCQVLTPLIYDYQAAQRALADEERTAHEAKRTAARLRSPGAGAGAGGADGGKQARGGAGGRGESPMPVPAGPPGLDFSFQEHTGLSGWLNEAPVEDGCGRLPKKVALPPPREALERAAATAVTAVTADATSTAGSAAGAAARRATSHAPSGGGGNGPPTAAGSAAGDGADGHGALEFRYVAQALRADNNRIADLSNLPTVLTKLLLHPAALLSLDLSSNQITTLGDAPFTACPHLQTLLLHDNRIGANRTGTNRTGTNRTGASPAVATGSGSGSGGGGGVRGQDGGGGKAQPASGGADAGEAGKGGGGSAVAHAGLEALGCILPLAELRRLTVYGNPVADTTPQLRLLLLAALPSLKALDGSTATQRERADAATLAASAVGRKALRPLRHAMRRALGGGVDAGGAGDGAAPAAGSAGAFSGAPGPISRLSSSANANAR